MADLDADSMFARKPADKAKVKRGKRYGGRKKGTPNRRTVDRLARIERELADSTRGRRKLAVEDMDTMIDFLRNLVAMLVPWDTDGTPREGRDSALWFRALDSFQGFLQMRAPYQSPKLSAVQIVPPGQPQAQRTVVNVTILDAGGNKVYSDSDGRDAKLIEGSSA